ncbi:MAG: Glycerol-3-phosphate ABC transporter, periplasmic glycerol-3-phosphate-binding protein [uncultured Thermomicrobiales bacterium]|uniref:Glycerol-3-phosphate ABC transporter, periplasmic glycerol-3-phosphate-binding protein n=1 Tax=uncultured Thermomicrobiales bacterium TaxID=1645740 RepID=A0A6J4UNW1_9BACT|nr:MAG: Glycerol-3-phosphate ABC transporter, periplasmic glycerol-3-phosphate-binding protein [uncultured Thermomicrobiales bacterium]
MSLSRRTIIKGAAGTATAGAIALNGKASSVFAAPNIIRRQAPVELNFWYGFTGVLGDRMADLINRFNETNGQGITVTGLAQANYGETAQNLTLSLQDGTNPDMALLAEIWWFRFYLAQQLLPLNDLISARSFPIDDVVDSFRYEGVRKGTQYWLPLARSTPLVYYNTDMWSAAGYDTFPATWSEVAAAAPSLNNEDQQVVAFALPPATDYLSWPFHGVVWAHGGAYSDDDFTIRITEPGAVAAGELYRRGIQEGWMYNADSQVNDFSSGFAAMMIGSTGTLAEMRTLTAETGIKWNTAFLPGEVPGINETCPTGGAGVSIMANIPPERQEAAFTFIEFFSSYPEVIAWAQGTGYMPTLKSAIAGPEMEEFFVANPTSRTAVDQLATRTKPQDVARAYIPGGDQIISEGISEILINGTESQVVFQAVAERLTAEAATVVEQVIALEGDLTSGVATPPAATPTA